MTRLAYVNGYYQPYDQATVPMNDRAYHFADSAYEVIYFNEKGCFVDFVAHIDRLHDSLRALSISLPTTETALLIQMTELMRRNRIKEGFLYIQVSRGIAPRDHTVKGPLTPSMTMFCKAHRLKDMPPLYKVFTSPDIRWQENHIKSTSLLPNILAKYNSVEQGGDAAWLVNHKGHVTEGASTNAWIVDQEGILRTHPANGHILNGIVRQRLLDISKDLSLPFEERAFSLEEAYNAQEAFLTSTTKGVFPIVSIDGKTIANGSMGPITERLHQAYLSFLRHQWG